MSAVAAAAERAAAFLARLPTRQGLLARARLGAPDPGDAALRATLVQRCTREVRPDGSVGASLLATAWTALELMDLGVAATEQPTARLVAWLLAQQGRPGGFDGTLGESGPLAHEIGTLPGGFFAPAAPDQRVAPLTLPTGKTFRAEAAARFAASALALRAVLRAGLGPREQVRLHLQSFQRLGRHFRAWEPGFFAPDVIACAVAPLAVAGTQWRETLLPLVTFVAGHQGADGEWPHAELFHVLEGLLLADAPDARAAVARAVPALLARQKGDGSFGGPAREERAWIGWQALELAARR